MLYMYNLILLTDEEGCRNWLLHTSEPRAEVESRFEQSRALRKHEFALPGMTLCTIFQRWPILKNPSFGGTLVREALIFFKFCYLKLCFQLELDYKAVYPDSVDRVLQYWTLLCKPLFEVLVASVKDKSVKKDLEFYEKTPNLCQSKKLKKNWYRCFIQIYFSQMQVFSF